MRFSLARLRLLAVPLALLTLQAPGLAQGQQGAPSVGYVYPAGVQRGTICEVTLGGQRLDGVKGVLFSKEGVHAEILGHEKPLNGKQRNELRERLAKARKRLRERERYGEDPPMEPGGEPEMDGPGGMEPADGEEPELLTLEQINELRKKLLNPNKQPNAQIAETVKLRLTVPPDAPSGLRELRLVTNRGVTNPVRFFVGRWPEVNEVEPNDLSESGEVLASLPVVVNGQVMPGDVDRFRFRAQEDCRLVVSTSARELTPYLADAVPGWFQATLALYDGEGQELAYSDDFRFHPDPVLSFRIPADGEYVLEIKDSIYRGREDFVYRIVIGELPFVTSVFPLGVRAGEQATVAVSGWNLPLSELVVDARERGVGRYPIQVAGDELASNTVPFAVDRRAESLESEPNDAEESAQAVKLPLLINGRIDQPGDRDVFRFRGKKHQRVVAEVYARRLNSPLDSVLRLTDAEGRELARNDDWEDLGAGLATHHADSRIEAVLPAGGVYTLQLFDAQAKGGEAYGYRLRLGPPEPDYELRVVPSAVNVRPGTSAVLTVHALRRDGFEGAIDLALVDSPAGFALSGGRIPAGQSQVRVTLSAPRKGQAAALPLRIEGRARVEGRPLRHLAVPADDMMQAFFYRHLVPAEELLVYVTKAGRGRLPFLPAWGKEQVVLPASGTVRLEVRGNVRKVLSRLELELVKPPPGISVEGVEAVDGGAVILLRTDGATAQPGLEGNLIIDAWVKPQEQPGQAKQARRRRRVHIGTLPAVRFVVLGS